MPEPPNQMPSEPMRGRALGAVTAIIPCLDEAQAIGDVVRDVLAQGVGRVIVVDGGSRDATAETARAAGADVLV